MPVGVKLLLPQGEALWVCKQSVHKGEHCRQGAPRRTLAAFSGSTGVTEGKEDNAARDAVTALKTNVHPCTLMQLLRYCFLI